MRVFYGGIYLERKALFKAGIKHPIKLEYYKTINSNSEKFGIEIVKTEYTNNNIIKEEKQIKNISNDESKIERMLKMLKSNTVTPITVQDVLDDLLKQQL